MVNIGPLLGGEMSNLFHGTSVRSLERVSWDATPVLTVTIVIKAIAVP